MYGAYGGFSFGSVVRARIAASASGFRERPFETSTSFAEFWLRDSISFLTRPAATLSYPNRASQLLFTPDALISLSTL